MPVLASLTGLWQGLCDEEDACRDKSPATYLTVSQMRKVTGDGVNPALEHSHYARVGAWEDGDSRRRRQPLLAFEVVVPENIGTEEPMVMIL